MSTGQQSTFSLGQATGLPRQSEAPQAESSPLDPPRPGGPQAAADEAPAVRLRRLLGVSAWALVLVLAGVASSIVGLFEILGDGPGWFTPAFISCGVIGMMLAMMAFATVRFRGMPWMFMAASSITLLAAFVMIRIA